MGHKHRHKHRERMDLKTNNSVNNQQVNVANSFNEMVNAEDLEGHSFTSHMKQNKQTNQSVEHQMTIINHAVTHAVQCGTLIQ